MTSENKTWKQNLEGLERSWETIGISNDFLFGKLMRKHPGLCQKLLQRILPDLEIDHIEVVETLIRNESIRLKCRWRTQKSCQREAGTIQR